MTLLTADSENAPWAPYRCPRCFRCDTIPMPAEHLLDHLIRSFDYAPFKCRACRAKFYRRPLSLPAAQTAPQEAVAARNVGVCQKDRACTLDRVEAVIQAAEGRRLRKG